MIDEIRSLINDARSTMVEDAVGALSLVFFLYIGLSLTGTF